MGGLFCLDKQDRTTWRQHVPWTCCLHKPVTELLNFKEQSGQFATGSLWIRKLSVKVIMYLFAFQWRACLQIKGQAMEIRLVVTSSQQRLSVTTYKGVNPGDY